MTEQDLGMLLVFALFPLLGLLIAVLVSLARQADLGARVNRIADRMRVLSDHVERLRCEVARLEGRPTEPPTAGAPPTEAQPSVTTLPSAVLPPRDYELLPPPVLYSPVAPAPPAVPETPPAPSPAIAHLLAAKAHHRGEGPPPLPYVPPLEPPVAPEEERGPRFDGGRVEVAIGIWGASRIGMICVLLAASFFLRHAFMQGWIRPPVVVAMGLAAGAILMLVGEWSYRRRYGVQSQVLTGGGAAVMYLTLFAALHLCRLLSPSLAFLAMAAVTALAACQALRHESETVAVFAWIAGYLVPALIGEPAGSAPGDSSSAFLFSYLSLLSVAVFAVACRYPWMTFTSLALIAAYSGGAYGFRSASAPVAWPLGYSLLVTLGMLWLAVARRERTGQPFGVVGAAAGYAVAGVLLSVNGHGSLEAPYLYFLVLSGGLLWLSRAQGWPGLQWCAVLGATVGLAAMLLTRATGSGELLLLYSAVVAAASLAISARPERSAEPLAVATIVCAYVAAALLTWASSQGPVPAELMLGYLAALGAAVLALAVRLQWRVVGCVGVVAAFLATLTVRGGLPGLPGWVYPLGYVSVLGLAALSVAANRDDRTMGALALAGVFCGPALAATMNPSVPELIVPVYLAVAAIWGAIAVIESHRWYGVEWLPLIGAWVLYPLWRLTSGREEPRPEHVSFAAVYLLTFLAGAWLRHRVKRERARAGEALFTVLNAGAFFAIGCWDLGRISAPVDGQGALALALSVVYLVVGVAATVRRPEAGAFGPVLLAVAGAAFSGAVGLLIEGYGVSVLWAFEAVIVMVVGLYFRNLLLRLEAWAILALALGRALAVDSHVEPATYRLLANSATLSLLAVVAALCAVTCAYARLDRAAPAGQRFVLSAVPVLASALLWQVLTMEAWRYVGWELRAGADAQGYAVSAVWTAYGAVLVALGLLFNHSASRWTALTLFGLTILKVSIFDLAWLPLPYRILAFLGLGVVLLAVSFAYQRLARPQARPGSPAGDAPQA